MEFINNGNGSILTSNSSARIDGGWSNFNGTAIFPFNPENRKHITNLLKCFKGIQKLDKNQKFSLALKKETTRVHKSLEGLMLKDNPSSPRRECTLQVLNIFDPQKDTNREYSIHFKPNPYSFTKPLNQSDYLKIYSPNETQSTRFGLATRIIERIKDGENISIVGAHRTGKTTVQNLVYDILYTTQNLQDKIYYLPIKINAATTPPFAIYSKIIDEINLWLDNYSDKIDHNTRSIITKYIKKTITRTFNKLSSAKMRFGTKNNYIELDKTDTAPERFELTWEITNLSKIQDAYMITTSLNDLRDFLQDISSHYDTAPTSTHQSQALSLVLVIIIDEVKGISKWESDSFTRIWRHVIESEDFQKIRWLISATKPISHEEPFSPVMNVFKEYNVGSLTTKECELLISSFDSATDQASLNTQETENKNAKLTPLITYESKVFLNKFSSRLPYFIQVFLYHIYNHTTRKAVPIANVLLCKKVIYEMVLGELSDYLKKQWIDVEDDIQQSIISSLKLLPKDPYIFMDENLEKTLNEGNFSSRTRKFLLRSGLSGDDNLIISPIVALWLITEGYCIQNQSGTPLS